MHGQLGCVPNKDVVCDHEESVYLLFTMNGMCFMYIQK